VFSSEVAKSSRDLMTLRSSSVIYTVTSVELAVDDSPPVRVKVTVPFRDVSLVLCRVMAVEFALPELTVSEKRNLNWPVFKSRVKLS